MPFNIPFSDIQKVIEEVTKHYILVPIEQADTQTLFLNFKTYADRLCSLLRERNDVSISREDAENLLRDVLNPLADEEGKREFYEYLDSKAYVELTSHSLQGK
jgi:hypothetical protein